MVRGMGGCLFKKFAVRHEVDALARVGRVYSGEGVRLWIEPNDAAPAHELWNLREVIDRVEPNTETPRFGALRRGLGWGCPIR